MSGEPEVLRERAMAAALAAVPRASQGSPTGAACVVKTTHMTAYPTKAGSWIAVVACDVGGTEQEGQPATIGGLKGPFLAAHIGATLPPEGTSVMARRASGAWVIQYG
jgi:hypothetical protein